MMRHYLISTLAAVSLAGAAVAQTVAIQGGTVWTGGPQGTVEGGTVIIEDGEIRAIGNDLRVPVGAEIIDAEGKWVTPGIIAPFTRVGLVEIGAEDSTNDVSAATSRYTVALDATKGFNPEASAVDVTRIEGVTRIVVAPSPSTGLFAGQGFVAATSGEPDSIIDESGFVFAEMGEAGAALAGGSRGAAWRFFEGAIFDARTYPGRYMTHDLGDSLNRADAQALIPVVRGQMPLVIGAKRASDIREIIRFKEANRRIEIIIVGAEEGWMVADELAAAKIPVIVDPFSNLPSSFEQLAATSENAQRLIEAGVPTAIAHIDSGSHLAHLILQSAGNAVANGVTHDDALASITSVPADIFGLEDLGRLQPGNRGDVVIWSGDPLEVMSSPETILIDGERQSLESRQTKLRDRYLGLEGGDQPYAYKR